MSQSLINNSEADIVENDANAGYNSRFQSDFEILYFLGKGAYGMVFEVKSKSDGKRYAVKRIDLTGKSSDLAKREIKIKDCQHPNIAEYIDSWVENPPSKWQEKADEVWMKKFDKLNLKAIALPYHDIENGEKRKKPIVNQGKNTCTFKWNCVEERIWQNGSSIATKMFDEPNVLRSFGRLLQL